MYVGPDGEINRALTEAGWLAPGVPGTVRGLALAHRKYGRLPWRALVEPAATLAASGFPLSSELASSINNALRRQLLRFPSSTAAYGKPGGGAWQEGDTLRLPDLGRTLASIADDADVFYTGWIADSLTAQMRANGGIITRRDLAAYRAVERAPVKGTFLGHEILSMAPPSSGGVLLIQSLNVLATLGIQHHPPGSTNYLHFRLETARRAYLDRARHLGDPDFVQVPVQRLTSAAYAARLAKGIDSTRASSSVALGRGVVTERAEPEQTTHFSVVDAEGNAVANTYTLEASYGSGVVVRGAGFLLNNEMGDFNRKPGETNTRGDIGTAPNAIAPGKRMLSSMTPTIVTRDGALRMVTGSPGGRMIPNTVLTVILGVTAYGMDARQAVDLPRLHHQWLPDEASFEPGVATDAVFAALRARGHRITLRGRTQGSAHTIVFDAASGTAWGAADLRSADAKASVPR
jgi:gamma-glutamyltranspeptidase/glutathione hydrolase